MSIGSNREFRKMLATTPQLTQLNRQVAIPGLLTFRAGAGGLPVAVVTARGGTATLSLHGGHVLQYRPAGGDELLWLSRHSVYAPGEPIRGGIPLCWPWFGAHASNPDLPAHGFARRRAWTCRGAEPVGDEAVRIHLTLAHDAETLALWPHPFRLDLAVTVGRQLMVALTMTNPGPTAFTCAAALHTYFHIGEICQVSIAGLEDCEYIDTVGGRHTRHRQQGAVRFAEEVDRLYLDTTATCVIDAPAVRRRITVAKAGSRATVVWNPWLAKAARMPDFGDDEWPEMLCVETVNAGPDTLTVPPQGSHTTTAVLSAEPRD
jgi:D-hexose-6-phosphate mutarotase